MFEYINGLYFFTATCNSWIDLLKKDDHKKIVYDSLNHFCESKECTIYGFVIMPNHIHILLGIESEKLAKFQHRFLKFTAQQIIRKMKLNEDPFLSKIKSTQTDRAYQFWERRPKWIAIIHSDIFWQKLAYIHNNPLQKGWNLADDPINYEASSALSYWSGKPTFSFYLVGLASLHYTKTNQGT